MTSSMNAVPSTSSTLAERDIVTPAIGLIVMLAANEFIIDAIKHCEIKQN